MKKLVPQDAILVPEAAKKVFEGEIHDVYQWPQELYDGSLATFEMLRRPDTTQVIAIVDRKIMVVNDTQPNRGEKITFPGGRIDLTDASTQEAAARELKEETGYEFEHWKLAKVWQPVAKAEWFIYVYIAWGAYTTIAPDPGPGEKIELMFKTLDEVKELIKMRGSHLGDQRVITQKTTSIEEIIEHPEFKGREVER